MNWFQTAYPRLEYTAVRTALSATVYVRALKHCANPVKVSRELKLMLRQFNVTFQENVGMRKTVKSNGRYFYRLHVPGWPSKAYDQYIESELVRIFSRNEKPIRLQFIVMGITKQCPLHCRHCYERNRLNQPETLSVDDLKSIIRIFQARGVAQILISGGEPLACLEKTLELVQSADASSDFWIFTSGFNLTLENALRLKKAGLTGIYVSLDHWDADFHNAFRGHPSAWKWATDAARNVRKAGLVLCLSLCATSDFISTENLWKYASLAKELGAGFIQILEARSVGHFKLNEARLTPLQIKALEDFQIEINTNPAYRSLPTVMYAGFHQRRVGCFGAGQRFLYIDPDGNLHACPFCQNGAGHCLEAPIEKSIAQLQRTGCHKFESVPHSYF